eukprot:m.2144 g.2144  ORF g.2144 m.2144 type:complete len:86 (+) comp1467_c0_seq1:480-737(+)
MNTVTAVFTDLIMHLHGYVVVVVKKMNKTEASKRSVMIRCVEGLHMYTQLLSQGSHTASLSIDANNADFPLTNLTRMQNFQKITH